MRLVTILILFTLAAAAYVANFAAKDHKSADGNTTELAAELGSEDAAGQYADADQGPGISGGMGSKAAEFGSGDSAEGLSSGARGANGLPSEFPSELTMRSGASPSIEQPSSVATAASTDAAGPREPSAPTRRRVAPVLRQPNAEENAERERLLAERFGTKAEPAGSEATMEKPMEEPGEVKVISLPKRKPARERSVGVLGIEEDVEKLDSQIDALENAVTGTAAIAATGQAANDLAASDLAAEDRAAIDRTTTATAPVTAPVAAPVIGSNDASVRARVIDATGQPLANVVVTIALATTGRAVSRVTSDANGVLVSDALAPGRYRLQVEKSTVPAGISSPVGMDRCREGTEPAGYGSVCVDVQANGPTLRPDIILPLSSGVQGTILGRTGAPVKGVLVRAVSLVPGFSKERTIAETDVDGFFYFGLVPGPYQLQMLLPGKGRREELTRSIKVDVKPGSALLLDDMDFILNRLIDMSVALILSCPFLQWSARRNWYCKFVVEKLDQRLNKVIRMVYKTKLRSRYD